MRPRIAPEVLIALGIICLLLAVRDCSVSWSCDVRSEATVDATMER